MPETIGTRLERAAKQNKQLTLAQFAEALGVSYETARKWVVGSTAPNRARLEQICDLLGVTPQWVMFGDSHLDAAGTAAAVASATLTPGAPLLAAGDTLQDALRRVVEHLLGEEESTREVVARFLPDIVLKPESLEFTLNLIGRIVDRQVGTDPATETVVIAPSTGLSLASSNEPEGPVRGTKSVDDEVRKSRQVRKNAKHHKN